MSQRLLSKSGKPGTASPLPAVKGANLASRQLIPISAVAFDEADIAAVGDVLRSGKLREGPLCRQFEERFAARVGASYAVSVSSGTAALHVACAALLQPGDEVVVPAFTFIATASMVVMAGARPVFCDVDPRTYNFDVADARRRLTPRTRAIIPVHLFGNPCDVEATETLAREHRLKIVWDAAQAHGARFQGQDIGRFDDAVCYSFYPSKNMTTAEGGMITTNDRALYEKCKLLRSHGQSGKYYHTLLGFNYRLTDVMAALGLKQLEKLPAWVEKRRTNARFLTAELARVAGIQTPVEQAGGESSFNLYSILLDLAQFRCDRDEFVRRLNADNIGATVNYPRALHQQPVFGEMPNPGPLPVSEDLSRRILSLPVHPALTDDELEAVACGVRRVATAVRR